MSILDYKESINLSMDDPNFNSLIMAAMRKADDNNLAKLESVFPEILKELRARYNAPGGCLTEQETAWLTRVIEERNEEVENEN